MIADHVVEEDGQKCGRIAPEHWEGDEDCAEQLAG